MQMTAIQLECKSEQTVEITYPILPRCVKMEDGNIVLYAEMDASGDRASMKVKMYKDGEEADLGYAYLDTVPLLINGERYHVYFDARVSTLFGGL